MRCVRVVVADRNPLVLRGLVNLLSTQKNFKVVASCVTSSECIKVIQTEAPDIALIDSLISGVPGLDILAAIASACIFTRVVFLAASNELRDLIVTSASAPYGMLRETTLLLHCLRLAANGDAPSSPAQDSNEKARRGHDLPSRKNVSAHSLIQLTEREREITFAVSEGLSNKEVGRRLNLSEGTIKVHLHHIYHKLSISNRAALAALAVTHRRPTWLAA